MGGNGVSSEALEMEKGEPARALSGRSLQVANTLISLRGIGWGHTHSLSDANQNQGMLQTMDKCSRFLEYWKTRQSSRKKVEHAGEKKQVT